MKNTLTLLTILLLSFSAKGQLDKGIWLVGGDGKFYSYNQDYNNPSYTVQFKYTNIDLSASVGYFFANKIAAGLRPKFAWLKGKGVGSTGGVSGLRTNTKRYGIGPFLRYYFLNEEKPFNLVSDISYVFGTVKPEGESGKMNEFSFMIGPVIYFNTSVGIELLLGYDYKVEEIKQSYKDVKKGFQIGVGLQIHLEN